MSDQPFRRPHAPRRAVGWARQVIADHGVAWDSGLTAIPCSQAELSARCGYARNDGRVYAYLRDLTANGVVECQRDLVLFDVGRLSEVERAVVVRPLTPRSVEVGQALTQTFGRAAADGTIVLEVRRSPGQASRPARLADMSAVLGLNRSSVHRHVRALRSHGRLADPRPRVSTPDNGVDRRAERSEVLGQLVEVQAGLVEALSAAHALRDDQERLYQALAPVETGQWWCEPRPASTGATVWTDELSALRSSDSSSRSKPVSSRPSVRPTPCRDDQERLYQALASSRAFRAFRAQLRALTTARKRARKARTEARDRKKRQEKMVKVLLFSSPGRARHKRRGPRQTPPAR